MTYPVRGLHSYCDYGPTLGVETLDLKEPLPHFKLKYSLTLQYHASAGPSRNAAPSTLRLGVRPSAGHGPLAPVVTPPPLPSDSESSALEFGASGSASPGCIRRPSQPLSDDSDSAREPATGAAVPLEVNATAAEAVPGPVE